MTVIAKTYLMKYPAALRQALVQVLNRRQPELHAAGGAVRDWIMGRQAPDLDLTVDRDAMAWARELRDAWGGAYVPLDEAEDVARVVKDKLVVDFSSFRDGSATIAEDLARRDFTVNSMAVRLDHDVLEGRVDSLPVLDPCGGLGDLRQLVLRCNDAGVFDRDPLRLLRAYRFMATLGLTIEAGTEAAIRQKALLAAHPAPERVSVELNGVMASQRAYPAFAAMLDAGVLEPVLPELLGGRDVEQPPSHHLDVLGHGFAALKAMEDLIAAPQLYFPETSHVMASYLESVDNRRLLKWAALFHDLGKPVQAGVKGEGEQARITFHGHERAGADIFSALAHRLRWSKRDTAWVRRLIETHMWPFHLNNVQRRAPVTPRAFLRLVKAVDRDLPGLFLLAMADSLAGCGPGKPAGIETGLAHLFARAEATYRRRIAPVLERPRLLNGLDLQEEFSLPPGPLLGSILDGLEAVQVEGLVTTRQEALSWVRKFLQQGGILQK